MLGGHYEPLCFLAFNFLSAHTYVCNCVFCIFRVNLWNWVRWIFLNVNDVYLFYFHVRYNRKELRILRILPWTSLCISCGLGKLLVRKLWIGYVLPALSASKGYVCHSHQFPFIKEKTIWAESHCLVQLSSGNSICYKFITLA